MTGLESFLLGAMVALTPGMAFLAYCLQFQISENLEE
jgi:hypothetical protein